MPRASDGTITLVAGNPVVADTDIVTSWANPTMADFASMMQDSLSRTGKGGMLVPFQNIDGTVSSPGITFTNAANTGFYRTATTLAVSWIGAIKASFAAALARFYTPVQMDSTLLVTGVATFTAKPVLSAGITGITVADLPTPNCALSATTGTFTTNSTTFVDVTNAAVVGFVSHGNPIEISLVPDGSAAAGEQFEFSAYNSSTSVLTGMSYQVVVGASTVISQGIIAVGLRTTVDGCAYLSPGSMVALYQPVAGTYTFKIQVECGTAAITARVKYAKLYVREV